MRNIWKSVFEKCNRFFCIRPCAYSCISWHLHNIKSFNRALFVQEMFIRAWPTPILFTHQIFLSKSNPTIFCQYYQIYIRPVPPFQSRESYSGLSGNHLNHVSTYINRKRQWLWLVRDVICQGSVLCLPPRDKLQVKLLRSFRRNRILSLKRVLLFRDRSLFNG